MMKKYPLIHTINLLLLLVGLASAISPKFVTTKVGENVTINLPEDFVPMKDDEVAAKFQSYRKPLAIYTTPKGQVEIGINVNNTRWAAKDMEMLKEFYKANIKSLYTNVNFTTEEVQKIKKRPFVVFEYTSEVAENGKPAIRKYTYIQYTVVKGKVMVFNLTCPEKEKANWQKPAVQIMQSVRIG